MTPLVMAGCVSAEPQVSHRRQVIEE